MVQCLTGVRFSDLDKVIQSFNEDPDRAVITIVTGKTKAQVTIPVHPWIVEIASDYSSMQLPLAGSSQKFNQQLRRIALESGLFEGALDKPSIDSAANAKATAKLKAQVNLKPKVKEGKGNESVGKEAESSRAKASKVEQVGEK